MIDWYTLLFFAFFLLFMILEKTSSHRTPYEYIATGQQIGLSGGTYSLLIQFMTGATFLFPLFLTVEFQLLSVFLILLEAIFLYFLLIKIKANVNITVAFLDQKKKREKPFLLWIFAIANLENLFLQTGLIAYLFHNLFQQSFGMGVSLFLAFCFVYFGLGGYFGLNRIGSILLYASFFILSFTTLTLFLNSGIGTVFEQYASHYSSLFSGGLFDSVFCFLTFSLVMVGQTCTSFYFWRSLTSIKENHQKSALRYSVFSWGAFLLAFVVLTTNFLVRVDTPELANLLDLAKTMNPFILHLVTYILFMLLVAGVGNNLYSIVSLFFIIKEGSTDQVGDRSHRLVKQGYLLGLIVCFLIGVSAAAFYRNLITLIPFFLSFFASASVPFLLASLTGRFREKAAFVTVLLMVIVAIGLIGLVENLWLIAPISGLTAFVIYTLIRRFEIVRT